MTSKSDRDNYSNQLNPNNDAYWSSRGDGRGGDDDDDGPRSGASSSSTSLASLFPPRPEVRTTRFTMAIALMDGTVSTYALDVEASSEMAPSLVAEKAYSHMRKSAPQYFQHKLGVVELLDEQGQVVISAPRSLKLHGYRTENITAKLVQRHTLTIEYRTQALAAQESCSEMEPDDDARARLARRHEVLLRASNHRAPVVVGDWEPTDDPYTEYFRRSLAREQLPVLVQWFQTCLPALARFHLALRSGTAQSPGGLGKLRIPY